jgi:AraC family transcriptional regulator, transcriptional activator of pobA
MIGPKDYKSFIQEVGDFGISSFDFSNNAPDDLSEHFLNRHYGFVVILEGKAIQIVDFEEHLIKRGRVLFLKKDQLYTWRKIDSLKGYVVLFTELFLSSVSGVKNFNEREVLMNNTISSFIILDEEKLYDWSDLLQRMQQEYNKKDELTQEVLFHYLQILNCKFQRESMGSNGVSSDRKKVLVNQFICLVNMHFTAYKTPKPYAGLLQITPNYLNSICNEVLDKKAGEVIQDRVILEAKRMLSHTNITVSALASSLGFIDNSYFGRYFRKASGLPPEQFRKNFPVF